MADRVNLEAALHDLGQSLDVPPPPDVTASVCARLNHAPARHRPGLLLRAAIAAVAVITAAGVVVAASPTVRAGLTDLLNLGGVQVRQSPGPPPQPSPQLPGTRSVTLDEARSLAGFPVRVPATLGPPDAVRVSDGSPPRIVSLIYRPGAGRPEPATDRVAARLDQFAGPPAPVFEKFAAEEDVRHLVIDGQPALWVRGPHPVVYVDRTGQWRTESARLAANTLIWQADDVTLRLEGHFTKTEALAVAQTTR
ncbi:MAG: hypothetical protein GEU86_09995 [Actinophytocola sp.]|nr:hypothetical protein [Actinophytocola sp.]